MKQTLYGTVLLVVACSSANAALLSRQDGQAYYDTDTDLTWLADANLASTSGYCSTAGNCVGAGDAMTWTQAEAWSASLNAENGGLGHLGVNNWRLPTVTDTGTSGCDFAYTGTDCGYNVDLSTSELARMFYGTLGNSGYYDTSGSPTGCGHTPPYCLTDTGPFSNFHPGLYWSGTEYAPDTSNAWLFDVGNGSQVSFRKGADGSTVSAWAVTPGDVLPVPVPPAVWLFGSALGVMGVMRRKLSS